MDEYFIGAGALLTAGPAASIADATLHAQPGLELAQRVEAALVDFEATSVGDLSRILIVASGWSAPRFRAAVVARLKRLGACGLVDVVATLAEATGTDEVHIFAHWQPNAETQTALGQRGIRVVTHPLDALGQAALVTGQRRIQQAPRVRTHDAA
jgi:hypothetical protein